MGFLCQGARPPPAGVRVDPAWEAGKEKAPGGNRRLVYERDSKFNLDVCTCQATEDPNSRNNICHPRAC